MPFMFASDISEFPKYRAGFAENAAVGRMVHMPPVANVGRSHCQTHCEVFPLAWCVGTGCSTVSGRHLREGPQHDDSEFLSQAKVSLSRAESSSSGEERNGDCFQLVLGFWSCLPLSSCLIVRLHLPEDS